MAKKKLKAGLIKKGSPLPGHPGLKFDSSHLEKKKAEKREHEIYDAPGTVETRIITIPRQFAVYGKREKGVRITPRRPKLRR